MKWSVSPLSFRTMLFWTSLELKCAWNICPNHKSNFLWSASSEKRFSLSYLICCQLDWILLQLSPANLENACLLQTDIRKKFNQKTILRSHFSTLHFNHLHRSSYKRFEIPKTTLFSITMVTSIIQKLTNHMRRWEWEQISNSQWLCFTGKMNTLL
jgi:hypothetical protein